MVRVARPIRSRKQHSKRKEDPIVKKLTRAVGLICLGFLLILVGVLLTVFGVADLTGEDKISSTMIVGPIILLLGLSLCTGGFIWYGANYRLRMERDVEYSQPHNGGTSTPDREGYSSSPTVETKVGDDKRSVYI